LTLSRNADRGNPHRALHGIELDRSPHEYHSSQGRQIWGTKPELFIPGYLWALSMFGILAVLEFDKVGLYLLPPFGATPFILLFLPDAPIAQPYALIVGSVVGASVGTLLSLFARGLGMAVLAAIVACLVICVVHAFHPPAVALALYPVLFYPGNWFPLVVVLPFAVIAVCSAAVLSRLVDKWPAYQSPCKVSGTISHGSWSGHANAAEAALRGSTHSAELRGFPT
jgi:CBS-domain-containing membrane protein